MSTEQDDHNENLKQVKEKYKILIVEDNPVIGVFLKQTMVDAGYRYTLRPTGKCAFDEWQTGGYDLVLLDFNLPDMTGLAVCASIRQRETISKKRTPIVMHTTQGREFIGLADIDGFLQKPASAAEIDDMIFWLLNKEV